MRALPVAFHGAPAAPGTVVSVVVTGEAGGSWHVERGDHSWHQVPEPPKLPAATATMDPDTAWKLVTKRRTPEEVRRQFPGIRIDGDVDLGIRVLAMVSVMA